jgi:predicted XRE-type DNA-binding protein
MQTKKELQAAIELLMREADLNASQFARKIGVSRQAVNQWLTTSCVTYDKLFELMKALGYEVYVFVQKEGDE